ncbi:sulfatase-like hydrolase/transferase [Chloroflexi bacterium TSY]|nr:sulfatase-like hydrolase/transferase [Chloroflexi bacterium TSY]
MSDLPNVLIIMTDQQKATASHLYGNTFCETPAMARLADEGVLFQNAFTPHPLCMPARFAFWTSQWPHTNGARRNQTPMPIGANHAARLWQEAGYHVGLIGKNHCFENVEDQALFNTWCEISHGGLPNHVATRGMDWFRPVDGIEAAHQLRRTMTPQNPRFAYATSDFPLEDYSTGLIAGQTVRFLEKHQSEPFALWVSIPDPHEPWVCPQQYADLFPPTQIDLPLWRDGEFRGPEVPERNRVLYEMLGTANDKPEDLYGLLAVYYGMVRFIDDRLGQILDALEQLGLREKTIVIFCSDHGDFSGEHRMQCKGGVFYDCLTHIPLIVSWPGTIPTAICDDSMVNLIDVVPTLLTLQNIEIPRTMQGQPLPTVIPSVRSRDVTFSEYGAGGPAFTMLDLAQYPKPWGRRTLIESLQWREAEGRRKMVRS